MLKRLLFVVLLAFATLAQATVYSLPWGPKPQFVDANGAPMSSGTLQTFIATSTTPQVTYTDSTGGVANPTTITLNTRGETPNEVWLTGGVSYKFVLKDSAGATVWTVDNVSGVNDVTGAVDEWKAGPTPTFVSSTSFTLAGDQTTVFTVGRRVKTTNSGGTVYSTITASVFGVSTTVTVVNDSGNLDSGLSAVSYGLLQATNKSSPPFDMLVYLTGTAGTNTITASPAKSAAGYITGQTFIFTPANTNTGATTLNVSSLGAKNVFNDNVACVGGELKAGVPVAVMYDGTQFQIVGRRFFKQPTRQVLITGTAATYTTPTGATRINVRLVGGGGGGAAATTNGGAAGNNTTFSTLTGTGGGGGIADGVGAGTGGAASGGDVNIPGGSGTSGSGNSSASVATAGGPGGHSAFGGGGKGGGNGQAGSAAATNSGGGGGGGGGNGSTNSGGGGGSGGYVEKLFTAPSTTYTYTVGATALGGTAGTNAGGGGAAGIIIVDEYYD